MATTQWAEEECSREELRILEIKKNKRIVKDMFNKYEGKSEVLGNKYRWFQQ